MEVLRRSNGAFIAAPSAEYHAMWIRDHLYATFSYWYLGENQKLKEGIRLIFELFKKYKKKIISRIASPIDIPAGIIKAKYDSETLEEITPDYGWGDHQLDALGLFLHVVSDLHFKNEPIVRNDEDKEILQLIVNYLRSVEYWEKPDYGMWEECKIRHLSSVGSVIAGLTHLKGMRLATVPDSLTDAGWQTFRELWPNESKIRANIDHCRSGRPHSHDCDSAQLSLIWPYHLVNDRGKQDLLISRIVHGHIAENGESHKLSQNHGLNRYWGDDYYSSANGISAEWPVFKFWLSIIYSQRHEKELAEKWFLEGCKEIIDGKIPESYKNGKPNPHHPLAWAHAIALIAHAKLENKNPT